MIQLFDYLSEKKNDFKGDPKALDKLMKKIATFVHATVSEKDAKRMVPFAENPELVSFINDKLKAYFIGCNEFKDDENGFKHYDIIPSWYLFTLLIYSQKVEDAVVFALERMKADKNQDLFILRRIFHLCNNPVYAKQLVETEAYFQGLNSETTIYRWLDQLGVTPPPTYKWELVFTFRAESDKETNPLSDNAYIKVKAFEPEGNGRSFEIDLSDRERNAQERWNDFSEEDYFRFKSKKIQLKQVPDLFNLREFIAELEGIYDIKFERRFDFSYFTKGFKKKENSQKWFLEQ